MGEFFTSYTFMGIMGVLLVGLIIAFFYLRNRQDED